MPRLTKKYLKALSAAHLTGKPDAAKLYDALSDKGLAWDSKSSQWQQQPATQAATDLVRIRVWSEASMVEEVARSVAVAVQSVGFVFQEQSQAYPCRPPKQAESRVYLTFKRR